MTIDSAATAVIVACRLSAGAAQAVAGSTALPAAGLGLAAALAAAFAATPLVRRLAIHFGAVDRPGLRSVHSRPIPYLGGLALFVGFAVGLGVLVALHPTALAGNLGAMLGVLLGGLVVLALGVADDCGRFWAHRWPRLADAEGRGLRPAAKLGGQVAAALILCAFGVRVPDIHRPFSPNPCAYIPFSGVEQYAASVLWVVAITNAVNLIDGLDGLAVGVSAISAATLLVVALLNSGMGVAVLAAAVLLGSCLGFLPFNFHPARIFMGDAGAMFLGFTLSALALIEPLKSPTVVTLALPILVLGVPVFDTGMAILRRWRQGRLIGTADRAHVHHRLLDLGLSHRDAVLTMYVISGWLGVGALAALNLRAHLHALLGALRGGLGLPMALGLGVAVGTALVLTPAVRRLARRVGALDHPGAGHGHAVPTPLLGGLALFAAFGLGLGVTALLGGFGAALPGGRLLGLLAGGCLVLMVGVVDDCPYLWAGRLPWLADSAGRGLRPSAKLLGEIAAAVVLCASGVRIPDIHAPLSRDPGQYVAFSVAAQYCLTILWVLGTTNAVNLIDGLDGLAAGVSAISAAALLLAALLTPGLWPAALVAAVLLGACLGFLPFNFHPARIFMGDAGALFLGFALGAISIIGPLKGATVVTLAVPVLALGLPVFDTLLAIIRRARLGAAIGARDLAHLHNRLMDLGLSHRGSVVALYLISATLALGSLAVQGLGPAVGVLVLIFVVLSAILGARLAGLTGAPPAGGRRPRHSLQT